ncbi:alpha/beta hydrolase [Litchfieldella rifensis]|uniref:Alpha/beta hydrolase n=1 Tax=Litchfieldella rifensis TaxID=762643 RepID=A0ABV7LLP7_9GAMM
MDRLPIALALTLLLTITLVGCASRVITQSPGPGHQDPELKDFAIIARDGYRLPLRHWPAKTSPQAVVLAVHGFNDHGGSFEILAESLTERGISVYAHDQRGFGTTAQRRLWPGQERLAEDVKTISRLLRKRYPRTPLYLVGNSMGAAVVMLALSGNDSPPVDGSVLISPAVWGQSAMPWYQRLGLWLGVRLFPSTTFSARMTRRLGIEPTDDPEIKQLLAKDPLILRSARVDTLYGVSRMMDDALKAAPRLTGPLLIMYGEEDQIIPPEAICDMLERLPDSEATPWRMAIYPAGYHMLDRYTGRAQTHADIASWLLDPQAPLPSQHEVALSEARRRLCNC